MIYNQIMHNQNIPNNEKTKAMVKGFQEVAQTLRSTVTTVKQNDITVTITAEPMVIDIQIGPSTNITTLPNKLKDCLNEAFKESTKKMIEAASKELENSNRYFLNCSAEPSENRA